MATLKPRSVFWIVTTHVVTTLFMLFLVGGVLASLVMSWLDPMVPNPAAALCFLAFGALGSWMGAHNSVSYLRKRAIIPDPKTAVTASVATFAALGFGLILLVNIQMWNSSRANFFHELLLPLGYELLYAAVATVIFALVTRRAFAALQQTTPRGFEVALSAPPPPETAATSQDTE
jgi:hypothetical protein